MTKIDRTLSTPRNEVSRAAIAAGAATLESSDRARFEMACGTGKTFVELGVAEQVLSSMPGPKRVLVQVPSLELIRQAKEEWAEQHEFGQHYDAIAVCSDQSQKGKKGKKRNEDEDDTIVLDPEELMAMGIDPNSTQAQDVDRIRAWLDHQLTARIPSSDVLLPTYGLLAPAPSLGGLSISGG